MEIKPQLKGLQRAPDGGVTVFNRPVNSRKSYLTLPGTLGLGITATVTFVPLLLYRSRFHGA